MPKRGFNRKGARTQHRQKPMKKVPYKERQRAVKDLKMHGKTAEKKTLLPPVPQPDREAPVSEDSEPEEPDALQEVLEMVGHRQYNMMAVESDDDEVDDGDIESGDAGEDTVMNSGKALLAGCALNEEESSHTDSESDDDGLCVSSGYNGDGDVDATDVSLFTHHFEQNLPGPVGELLLSTKVWKTEQLEWPVLGRLNYQTRKVDLEQVTLSALDEASQYQLNNKMRRKESKSLVDLGVLSRISENVTAMNERLFETSATELQKEILSVVCEYRDLYFPHRSADNQDQLRIAYLAHVLGHVLRTRTRIVHHNSKLSRKDEVPDTYRDQGLTRPKVLIVVPFRSSAFWIVNALTLLLQPEGQTSVFKYKRFVEEFGCEEEDPPAGGRAPRPDDFLSTFTGNTDDAFRLGIQFTKKSMRLYSDFYHSDVVLASPLGLRTIIGAEGESERDFDFLNSIEILILDQTDVFLMQNWEHVVHLLQHMHLQPRDSRGVDFSRVRYWTLSGWQRIYRQTLVFSALPTCEVNALVSSQCLNYAGRVVVQNPPLVGTIQQVIVQVPQRFHRFSAASPLTDPEERFQFFIDKILPHYQKTELEHVLLLVPSYFDYVRLRNHFIKETVNFAQVCEYTKDSRVSRARDMFFHGKRRFLLYTERFHFFRRYRIKGIRHVVFYGLPMYPHFYSELCNLMQDSYQNPRSSQAHSAMSCTVLFSRLDVLKLARVVGSERAAAMVAAQKDVHMYVTGGS